MEDVKTVGIEFSKEQARVRALMEQYKEIGIPGNFGAIMMSAALLKAEEALERGDVAEILDSYQELKSFTD